VPTIDITRILCPIDFSESSRHALEHAAALAHWYDARITALHVSELFQVPAVLPGNPSSVIGPYISRDTVIANMEQFTAPLRDSVPIEIALEEGTVARTIVETATRLPADLIVMGTHGRGGVEHLMLGSVTEKVLRKTPCPVLVVPPAIPAQARGQVRFERILCPVDFGASSRRALTYALSLAQETQATLTMLHVLEPIHDESVALPYDRVEHYRQREADAREQLREAIPDDARDWCRPVEIIGSGKPYREILRVAAESRSDLIVMGVEGHSVLERMFFGSTANHVVRRAACPVLTLRSQT
jgi:nucleotide-binding universal stress UspA family protein